MLTLFTTLAHSNRWANSILNAEMAKLTPEQWTRTSAVNFGSIQGIANHLLLADRMWLWRFTGKGQPPVAVDGVPCPDMPGLAAEREALDERILSYVAALGEGQLGRTLRYTNLAGLEKALPLGLCLAHFFNHQTHHRGQIHALLGVCDIVVPDVDLLYFPGAQDGWSA